MMAVTTAHAPQFIVGLVSAAIICATMSSADSNLLCMSTMVMNDLVFGNGYGKAMSEKKIIFITRILNVIFAVIAMLICMFGVDIVTMNTFAFGILPVVFGCAVGVVTFFIINAIELKLGVKPAPSAFIEEKK